MPVLSQKDAISPSGSTYGFSRKVYAVPLVPKLTVTIPGLTLPVPTAPYILSPDPASILHSIEKPKRSANNFEIVPIDLVEDSTFGTISK